MNTYHHHGTLMRMCHNNSGKSCLVAVKMRKIAILKVFRCYLVVIENETKRNFVMFFKPELGL